MNFLEAIKTCVKKKYTKGEGRASRSEFWYFFLFFVGVVSTISLFVPYMEEIRTSEFTAKKDFSGYLLIPMYFFILVFIIPFINVHIRRLNDINTSGSHWMGAFGGLFLLISISSRTIGISDVIVAGLWTLYGVILILCLKPGDKKDNKYGRNIYKKSKK